MKKVLTVKNVRKIVLNSITKTQETKWLDTFGTNVPITWDGMGTFGGASNACYCLSDCSQGSTTTSRIGDTIRVKSIQMRADVIPAQYLYSNVRFIIFQLNELRQGPTLVTDDIVVGGSVLTPLSPYRDVTQGRITVLYDKTMYLNPWGTPLGNITGNTVGGLSSKQEGFSFLFTGSKFFQRDIHFNGNIADMAKNRIFLLAVSDNPSAGSAPQFIPTFNFYCRIRFTDS